MKCLYCIRGSKNYTINGKKYSKVKTIGEGGYSFVVEVQNKKKQRFAVKCVRVQCKEQGDAVDREISSFQAVCGAEHVVQLLDYTYHETSSTDKMAYLLFPLLKNGSVQDVITRNAITKTQTSEKVLLEWTVQLCKATMAFHSLGLVHRDIKPGNMMLSEGNTILLTDLGSVSEARVTVTNRKEAIAQQELAAVNCTSPFRAPELFEVPSDCTISEATDMWSIGCTMYAMAFGESPFDGSATAAVSGRIRVPDTHAYSNKFIELIRSCLKDKPDERPSPQQLIDHIHNLFSPL